MCNTTVGNDHKMSQTPEQSDFVMLRLETDFRDSVCHNAFATEKKDFCSVATIRFDVVIENLWRYYKEKGGHPELFKVMLRKQFDKICNEQKQ